MSVNLYKTTDGKLSLTGKAVLTWGSRVDSTDDADNILQIFHEPLVVFCADNIPRFRRNSLQAVIVISR